MKNFAHELTRILTHLFSISYNSFLTARQQPAYNPFQKKVSKSLHCSSLELSPHLKTLCVYSRSKIISEGIYDTIWIKHFRPNCFITYCTLLFLHITVTLLASIQYKNRPQIFQIDLNRRCLSNSLSQDQPIIFD